MNRHYYWLTIVLFGAACSGGGSSGGSGGAGGMSAGSGGSGGSGSGGATSGSGGSASGTGGGTGGSVAGTGGSKVDGGPGGADGGNPGTGGTTTATDESVLQRSGDAARTGNFIRPALTKAKAATMTADAAFNASYGGTLTGVPLYLANGPGGKGAFFVATQSNNIYAFDETTGAQIWMKNAGATGNGSCDNQGKGVMSTPAIDSASRTIFVAAANGPGTLQSFKVYAYDVDTGAERMGWPVDIGQVFGNGVQLSESNQRGALLLVNGILYVPFGGQVGDCDRFRTHGRVVAINIADPTKTGSWSTQDEGGAIWAPGGLASDGTAAFAITGNHFPNGQAPATHGDSEEVVRLTGLAQLTRSNANMFFPGRWQSMDIGDLDFGADSPLVMDVPGATPAKFVAAPSKDGHLYFLDPSNLGGMGGEAADLMFANEGMSSAKTTPAAYQTSKGAYVVLSTQGGHCPGGGATGNVVVGVSVAVTAGAIKATVAWCAAIAAAAGNDATQATSPIATTTDGKTDAVVWYVSNGVLKGVDGDTGASVFSGGNCQVQRWTSLIAAKGARIVAGGNGKLCSWSAM